MRRTTVGCVMLAFIAVFALSGCAEFPTAFQRGDTKAISHYASYAWVVEGPYVESPDRPSEPLSSTNSRLIQNAVEKNLAALGYRKIYDTDRADFLVSFTIGTRDRISIHDFPTVDYSRYNPPHFDDRDRAEIYTEGRLAIKAIDRKSGEVAWRGTAYRRITKEFRETIPVQIDRAVGTILKQFPQRRT